MSAGGKCLAWAPCSKITTGRWCAQRSQGSRDDTRLGAFDIDLDDGRREVLGQRVVEALDGDSELVQLRRGPAHRLQAAVPVRVADAVERPRSGRVVERAGPHVDTGKARAQRLRTLGQRLEGDVAPARGKPDGVLQDVSVAGPDVDEVAVLGQRLREQALDLLVVAPVAPALRREGALHAAQLRLEARAPRGLQDPPARRHRSSGTSSRSRA